MDRIKFVLGRFSKEDREVLDQALRRASDAVIVMFAEGVEKAMNLYNGKLS